LIQLKNRDVVLGIGGIVVRVLLDGLHPNDEGGGLIAQSKRCVSHGNLQLGCLLSVGAVSSSDDVAICHQSSTAPLVQQAVAEKQGNLDIFWEGLLQGFF
jgi:hypothetical protein